MSKLDVHAVPGLEARHEIDGIIVLGDQQGDLPRFYLDEIQGLHSLPELDDSREAATGRGMELLHPSLPRGKTLGYIGRTQADDAGSCRSESGRLRAALMADPEQLAPREFRIVPHDDYGGHTYRFLGRVQRFDQDERVTYGASDMPSAWQRNFTLVVRMADGRFIVDDDPQTFQTPDGAGNNNPFVDVVNEGTAPADPVIRIEGPIAPPRIGRPGADLIFEDLVLSGVQHMDIDFANRTILRNDGTDLTPKLTSASTWWNRGVAGIPKGPADGSGSTTRITLYQPGGNPGVGANARVQFDPAVW